MRATPLTHGGARVGLARDAGKFGLWRTAAPGFRRIEAADVEDLVGAGYLTGADGS